MVTKACPNCGREIAPEDHFCSYCRFPVTSLKPRMTFQEGIKAETVSAAGSAVLSFAALTLWMLLTESLAAPFGMIMTESIGKSFRLMMLYIIAVPLCGAAFHLILSGFCANSKVTLVLTNAAVTLALCFTGAFLSVFATSFAAASRVSPEYIYYMVSCIRGILIMVPLVQGALFLCAAGRGWKKGLVGQISLMICFLLLAVAAELLTVMFLHMAAVGILFASVAAAAAMFLISLISQCFK